jgi:subtilisin family serine protease
MQWFLAPTDLENKNPDPTKRPHIISQSYNNWSCTSPTCDRNYERATKALIEAGIHVVNSAGNRGSRCGSINPNARYPDQISVASLRKESDDVSSSSSRGPNPRNANVLKPDIAATGESVVSAGHRSNNQYIAYSGTSMATPAIGKFLNSKFNLAGGIALLFEAVPELIRDIKKTNEILFESSKNQESRSCSPFGSPNGDVGYGTANFEKAIELAKKYIKNKNHF